MNRREFFLKSWARLMRTAIAAVIALPAIQYILDTFRKPTRSALSHVPVKRLKDLPPHKPTLVPIKGRKLDAWTQHEETIVGRVWLIRQEEGEPSETTKVLALSSICPHTGCQVRCLPELTGFFCPCHQAKFAEDGAMAGSMEAGAPSPSPRGMDELDCQIVKNATTGDLWVEVKYERFQQGVEQKVPLG